MALLTCVYCKEGLSSLILEQRSLIFYIMYFKRPNHGWLHAQHVNWCSTTDLSSRIFKRYLKIMTIIRVLVIEFSKFKIDFQRSSIWNVYVNQSYFNERHFSFEVIWCIYHVAINSSKTHTESITFNLEIRLDARVEKSLEISKRALFFTTSCRCYYSSLWRQL